MTNYVIIGNSAAGVFAAEAIREFDSEGRVTILSDESYPVYSRCLTSYYIGGAVTEQNMYLRTEDFYELNKLNLMPECKATSLNCQVKKVHLADGSIIPYDKLLIASGSLANKLKIPGGSHKDVFTLRNFNDAKAIVQKTRFARKAIVLGAGLVSLKGAYNLLKRGLEVIVLVSSWQILSQVLDEKAASIVQKLLELKGMNFRFGVRPAQILADSKGELEGIMLDDDEVIAGDMVLVGKGVTPNLEFIKGTPIVTHQGILVNEYMETSVQDVYAAGDVAETYEFLTGEYAINAIWPNAAKQGRIAGLNMAGYKKSYEGSLAMNSFDFFEVPIISVGITRPNTTGYTEEIVCDSKENLYRKLVFKENKLVGYILVGEIREAGKLMGRLIS